MMELKCQTWSVFVGTGSGDAPDINQLGHQRVREVFAFEANVQVFACINFHLNFPSDCNSSHYHAAVERSTRTAFYLSPPPPPIDSRATIKNTHQYFWKKVFSCCSSCGTSLPSASTCGGARVFQIGAGPSSARSRLTLIGSYSLSCLAASSLAFLVFGTGGRAGIGFPFAFARATFFL